jgi:putative protease
MAIHSVAGASQLRRLGIRRVVLARELTIEEVAQVTALPDLEVEVFLHGALCYAYSGLCLLSSHCRGLSGNRGCCSYLCRNSFRIDGGDRQQALMSMKDLALAEALPALRQAGVAALKIEGRKKSALYVAAVTAYYRGLLDGTLTPEARRDLEHDVRTIFSRPWTRFHTRSTREAGVTDPDTVGHRGAPVGTVETVLRGPPDWLVFTVRERSLERFDGLQLDLPGREKPFGFSVEEIRLGTAHGKPAGRSTFAARRGTRVTVPLPERHPRLPVGATVYCGSSQAVKRSYRWTIPRPGTYGVCLPVNFQVEVTATGLAAAASAADLPAVAAALPTTAATETARDPATVEAAARQSFAKLGGTAFACDRVTVINPEGRFARMADFNELRRRVIEALDQALAARLQDRIRDALSLLPVPTPPAAGSAAWELAVDRPEYLDAIAERDLAAVAEVTLFIHRLDDAEFGQALSRVVRRTGRERLRLALPAVVRPWHEKTLVPRMRRLLADGFRRWEVANLAGLAYLQGDLDLAAGWPLYALNRLSLDALAGLGFASACCSPEDGRDNLAHLLADAGDRLRVSVYQDTPLAISAVCAFVGTRGRCSAQPGTCGATTMALASRRGDRLLALNDRCQTAVLNAEPLCWAHRVPELVAMGARRFRAEFIWRAYDPGEVARLWSRVRQGERIGGTHEANWERGLEQTATAPG